MRKISILLLCVLPAIAFAGGKDKLMGNWREVKRVDNNNKPVAFNDTIHIEFLAGNEYVWQKSGSFIYKGTYKVENGNLDIGRAFLKIISQNKNKLVLADDMGQYVLEPYTPSPQGGATPPKRQEKYDPVTNIGQMAGHWSVYKRTADRTLEQVDYTTMLKMVDIFSSPKDGGKYGYFYAAKDADNAPSWYVERFENGILYCNGKSKRTFKVMKAQDNELIFEENGITYFFKQFK